MAKITKFKLEFEEDSRFSLVAISSCELPPRMAWLLNGALHVDFENTAELHGREVDGERVQFPVFVAPDEFGGCMLTLFTNKLSGQTLIGAFPNIDYLLKISKLLDDEALRGCCAAIRAAGGVALCTPVPDDKKSHPTLVDF